MPIKLSEMTFEAVLRTYSSVKGHRTRCEREIENLLALLEVRYSSVSEERIKDRLENLEKHTLRLADIKDYLVHLKYSKAKDHDNEVKEFLETLDRCSSDVLEILHNCHGTSERSTNPESGSCWTGSKSSNHRIKACKTGKRRFHD